MAMKKVRGGLFIFIALVVWLPLLNYWFGFIESGKLNGVSPEKKLDKLSWASWWSGRYQEQRNDLLNDSIGFRPDLVRLTNQLDYTLFHKINGSNVVLGKDDYLFESGYIKEYNGIDYAGADAIQQACYKMRRIQDTLEKLGKTFVFAISPSKAYFFPEKIPASMLVRGRHQTTYTSFRQAALSQQVHMVDFNDWFLKMKDTSRHVLITRQGIHWSLYGATLAADSMLRYMTQAGVKALPRLDITGVEYSDEPRSADADLGRVLNMIYPLAGNKYSYPKYDYIKADTAGQAKVIFIGDSFLWLWIDNGMVQHTGKTWEFWYYYNTVWGGANIEQRPMKDHDQPGAIGDANCIVVMYTPFNLGLLCAADSFLATLYTHYYPGGK